MKRFLLILISIMLAAAMMVTPAFAAEGGSASLSASAVSGRPGETVYVTVSISGYGPASAIGLVINSDLKMNAAASTWLLDGVLEDIGNDGYCAWACNADQEIEGAIATLAFVIPEPAVGQTNFTYSISCAVTVKSMTESYSSASASTVIKLSNPATGLSLSSSTLKLDMAGNAAGQLTATVTPANSTDAVVWSSSDSSVASVSGGSVTGWKPGTAVITATAGALSQNCTVTVSCSHNLTTHNAKNATCQETGNKLYYTCNACGVVLDANKAETTVADQTLAIIPHAGGTASCTAAAVCSMCNQPYGNKLPHDYSTTYLTDDSNHWYKCKNCDAVSGVATHALEWFTDKEATEDATGLKHQECFCGYITSQNTVIDKLPHAHIGIQEHAAVASTCKINGTVKYWTCSSSKCAGKYYGDAACQVLLETIEAPLDKTNHKKTELRKAAEASCYQNGYTGDTHCVDCDALVTAGSVIYATGNHVAQKEWMTDDQNHWHGCTTSGCTAKLDLAAHKLEWFTDKEATEDATGLKHQACSCGYITSKNTVIDKLPHAHIGIQEHAAVASTCTVKGNVKYWTCSSPKCSGKYYSDAACQLPLESIEAPLDKTNHKNTELRKAAEANCYQNGYTGDTHCADCDALITAGSVIYATGNHVAQKAWKTDDQNHWHDCATSGCTAKLDLAAHTLNWYTDEPATEDTTGLKHQECACGYITSKNTVIDKLPHAHIGIQRHAAVASTCTTKGNVEYWTCSSAKCAGKYYGDAACQLLLDTIETPINPANHKKTEVRDAASANCYQDGYTGDTYCVNCNQMVEKGDVIKATGKHVADKVWKKDEKNHWYTCTTPGCNAEVGKAAHKYEWVVDKAATEDATGLKHQECVCGEVTNKDTVIEKLDHVHVGIKETKAVKATCLKEGTVRYWTCSSAKCAGKYYSDAACQLLLETIVEPINPDNHAGKKEVKDKVEATCSKKGYSGDTYCTGCKELIEKGKDIPATGKHTPKTGYQTDDAQHWKVCADCDAVVGGAKEDHTYKWIVDKNPTEAAEGKKHQECTVCGHETKENTKIDKLVHNPVRVDGKKPTCTEDGVMEHYHCGSCGLYYASENGKPGKQVSKAGTVLEKTGHDFDTEWTSDEKGHWHVCACGEVEEKENHDFVLVGAVEATDTEAGYTGDEICMACEYVKSTGQEVPAKGLEQSEEPTEDLSQGPEVQPEEQSKNSTGLLIWMGILMAAIVAIVLVLRKMNGKK